MTRALSLALLVGCQQPDVETPRQGPCAAASTSDHDEDGLTDRRECRLGTDPDNPDTDGDGWADGQEVDGENDPLDEGDHPYLGGWPMDSCRSEIVGIGNAPGEVAYDFTLMDQFGDDLRLHDFCDHVVLLIASAAWMPEALWVDDEWQSWYETYRDDGLMVIGLLGENKTGGEPTLTNLQSVVADFGIEYAYVADPGFEVTASFMDGNHIALPSMTLIDRGSVVVAADTSIGVGNIEGVLDSGRRRSAAP